MKTKTALIALLVLLCTSCKTNQTSMLIGDTYDAKTNQTTLSLLPYGTILLPGKWLKTSYNQTSRQHFFTNDDSTIIAVAKNPNEKYPFYKAENADKEFVTEFVAWDAQYWESQGLQVTTLDDQSGQGYILWQVKSDEKDIHDIFLFGSKNQFAYNFSGSSKTWTEERIKEFLVSLYREN